MTGFARLALCLALAAAPVALAACEQGEGQRCQVNSDCADGLVCVIATNPHLCQSKAAAAGDGGIEDANVDGPLPDAEIDATVDAPPTP